MRSGSTEQNGDEDRRRDCVEEFAAKFVRHRMVDSLGASRAGENQREVDAERRRRDRPIGDRQAPTASAGEERSVACEPGRRFRGDLSLGRHPRRSQFIGDRRPMARQSSHVPSPQIEEFDNHSKLRVSRGSWSWEREQRRRPRPRPSAARRIDAAHCKRISIQDKSSGDRSLRRSTSRPQLSRDGKYLDGALPPRPRSCRDKPRLRLEGRAAPGEMTIKICLLGLRRLDIQILPGYTTVQSQLAEMIKDNINTDWGPHDWRAGVIVPDNCRACYIGWNMVRLR
jgi:hypothetical protein